MKKVLVFGASSAVAQGICAELMRRFDVQFYFVARDADKLAQMSEHFGGHFAGSYCLDLQSPTEQQLAILMENVQNSLGSFDLVIVAQGELISQIETESSDEALLKTIELNGVSVLRLIMLLIRHQKKWAFTCCKFLVITSVAGQRGRPRNFSYGAAKGAVSTFLQGLRSVYYKTGFEFYDLRLGPVDTPMTANHKKNFSFSNVDFVSKKIADILSTKQYVAYVPGFWRWVMLVVKLMPEWLFQRLAFLSTR